MAEPGLNSVPTDSVKTDSIDTASYAPKSGLEDVTLTKGIQTKGAYALGTPIGPTGFDPELLKNMQQLINEKEKQKNSFLEGLKDATAWWSGGVAGPAEALQNRAAEKDRQDAELFGMKAQLSQAKTSQQLLAQRRNNMLLTLNNLAGGEAGAVGSGGTGGAGPTSGGYNRDVLNRVNELYANGQYDAGDKLLDNHLQEISKINRTAALNKDFYGKTIEVDLGGGKIGYVSVNDVVNGTFKPTPKGQAELKAAKEDATPDAKPPVTGGGYHGVAADVNNPTGIKQNGGFKTYDTPQAGVADTQRLVGTYLSNQGPMANTKVTPENLIGTWITGDAAKGADPQYKMHVDLIKSELDKAGVKLNADGTIPNTPQANAAVSRAKIIGETGLQNAAKFLPHVTIAPATNVAPAATNVAPTATAPAQVPVAKTLGTGESIVPAAAPAAAPVTPATTTQAQLPAIPPAPAHPSTFPAPAQVNLNAPITSEMKSGAAAQETYQKSIAEGAAKSLNDQRLEFEDSIKPINVADRRDMFTRGADIVANNPKIVGVLQKPGVLPALAQIAESGAGPVAMQGLDQALFQAMPGNTQKDINDRDELKTILVRNAVDARKLAKGQGSISDYETKMFSQVSGSIQNTPENLLKRFQMLKARADLDDRLGQMYRATGKPGQPKDFQGFMDSPEAMAEIRKYHDEITGISKSHPLEGRGGAPINPFQQELERRRKAKEGK